MASAARTRPQTTVVVRLMRTAAALAVIGGGLEFAARAWLSDAPATYLRDNPHHLWLAPVGYLILLGPPAVLLAAAHARFPRLVPLAAAVFVAAAGALLGVLTVFLFEHRIVLVLATFYLAFEVARSAQRRPHRLERWLGGAAVGAIGALSVAGAALLVAGVARDTAGPDIAAARADAPHVLIVSLGGARAASLGLYGYDRPTTPVLARLAQRGVVFERAIAPSARADVSWASMLTGVTARDADARGDNIARRLRAAGYSTAAFIADRTTAGNGFGRGTDFEHYEDHAVSLGELVRSSSFGRVLDQSGAFRRMIGTDRRLSRRSAAQLNRDVSAWLANARAPFFATVAYADAELPFLAPDTLRRQFGLDTGNGDISPFLHVPLWTRGPPELAAASATERIRYDAAIAAMDAALGELLDTLEAAGTLDNTLVIVTSPHGADLGERGLFHPAGSHYLTTLHVPLVVLLPNRRAAGTRIHIPVSLTSLAATIEQLTASGGSAAGGPNMSSSTERHTPLPGGTLPLSPDQTTGPPVVAWTPGDYSLPTWAPAGMGPLFSRVTGDFHFIQTAGSIRELYRLSTDPEQTTDLLATRQPGTANSGSAMLTRAASRRQP